MKKVRKPVNQGAESLAANISSNVSKTISIILIISALVIYLLGAQSFWFYTVEDSFISFRYCDNMLAGKGLVFNPGTKVEGYTNFLWVMVISLPRLLLPFPLAAKMTGLIIGATLILAIGVWGSRKKNHALIGPLAAVLVALCPGYQMWSVSGLETILFTTCLSLVFLIDCSSTQSKRMASGMILGLATLTRPEGALFFCLFVGIRTPFHSWKIRTLLDYVFGYLLVVGPHLLFRIIYYNALIPNTFWVKSQRFRESGLLYFVKYAALTGVFTVPVTLSGLFQKKKCSGIITAATMGTVYLFYVYYIGGDWMPYGRFLIPVLPMFAIASLQVTFNWSHRWIKVACAIFLIAAGVISTQSATYDLFRFRPTRYRQILTWETEHMKQWIQVGQWLGRNYSPSHVLCTGLAGVIPYYSGLITLDRGGLNDREIARIVHDSATMEEETRKIDQIIRDRLPELVMIEEKSFNTLTKVPALEGELPVPALWFSKNYKLQNVKLDGGYFAFYQRRD